MLVSAIWCHPRAQAPYFQQFDTKNGIPSSEVYGVAFDVGGQAWFPTDRGICTYNGYEFKVFTTQEGLPNNTVLEIKKDPQGRLWFMTRGGKLCYQEGDQIIPFEGNDQIDSLKEVNFFIRGMAWDGQGRMIFWKQVWNNSTDNFYFRWDSETGKLENHNFESLAREYPSGDLPEFRYLDLAPYFIPEIGLSEFILRPNGDFFYIENRTIGDLYFGNIHTSSELKKHSFGKHLTDLYMEGDSILWIGSNHGLIRLEPPWDAEMIQTYFPETTIGNIARDREGNYWMTTLANGIRMIPSFQFDRPAELSRGTKESFLTIFPLEDHLIVSTQRGEIFALDTNFQMELLHRDTSLFGAFYTAVPNQNGIIFLETFVHEEDGKVMVDTLSLLSRPTLFCEFNNSEYYHFGRSIHRWFKMGREGPINLIKGLVNTGRIESFLKTDSCMWAGSENGLYCLDLRGEKKLMERVELGEHLDGYRVNSLKGNADGVLFVGTIGNGLVMYDGTKTHRFGKEDGLSSNMINQIALENDSTVWLGTNNGLDRLTFRQGGDGIELSKLIHLGPQDGLPGNYIISIGYWRGLIWVSTDAGLTYFNPETLLTSPITWPAVMLKSVRINQQEVPLRSVPEWAYDQNNLTLNFQAISYSKPIGLPFYRYRLLPRDSTWSLTDNRRVQYLGLPPGAYTFEVAARNNNGDWNPSATTFAFHIRPHYSQTWWFILVVVLGGIAILAGISYLRSRQKRLKEIQNRNLQEARIKAKESELAALRNQINPHFIFNALNSIQNFIFKNDIPQASHYLGQFAKLMRDGLEFSTRKRISLEEELDFLKVYLDLESLRFPVEFSYRLTVDPDLDPKEIKLPPFIFQPILENTVKHGFKNIDYHGLLEFQIERVNENGLSVVIRDNGTGLGKEWVGDRQQSLYTSRGLKIVKNQIDLINSNQESASFTLSNRKDGPGVEAIFHFTLNNL